MQKNHLSLAGRICTQMTLYFLLVYGVQIMASYATAVKGC